MNKAGYEKLLSRTDCSQASTHQSGMLVPKTVTGLLQIFPHLDPGQKNPRAIIICEDEAGERWKFNFIYYNNSLHDPSGTRNEYRLTGLSTYFRSQSAKAGDRFQIRPSERNRIYFVSVLPQAASNNTLVRLRGWRTIH